MEKTPTLLSTLLSLLALAACSIVQPNASNATRIPPSTPTQPALLPAATQVSPTPTQPQATLGFHPTPCRFFPEKGQNVTCGDLVVPENRSQPQDKTISLHVAVIHNPTHSQPDPVIYLHGGPGGGALEWERDYAWFLLLLFPGRDLIFYDQRGTGFSQPRLACSIAADYAASLAQDERLSEIAWEADLMPTCLRDLEAQGIDLSAYTTLASAADLQDLILALGYDQVNLFGQSYGTNLALTYLDEYGAQGKLRSLILDGVSPPEANLFAERGLNAQDAFQAVFAACAADPACSQAFPDAEQHFYSLLERLAASPITLTAEETGSVPVVVNDHRLIEALYRTAYISDRIPNIPVMLASFERGDYRLFRRALADMLISALSVDSGVYFAVRCSDQNRLPPAQAPREELQPPLQDYFQGTEQAMRRLCADPAFSSAEVEPVRLSTSDKPVLLLSGAFDPATPPAWAKTVAKRLTNAYHYTSPTGSHDQLMLDACAKTITTRFIQDLTPPDDPCLQQVQKPYFFTGGGN
jgi:pimeloyl-ACP methyl ester carboxylesterase